MDGANNRTNRNTARSTHPAYTEYRLPNQPSARPQNGQPGQRGASQSRSGQQRPDQGQPGRQNVRASYPNQMSRANLPAQTRQRQLAEVQRQRDLERRRMMMERRQEEARRLAEETKKRAEAAAKAAAREAKRAQAKLFKELRKLNTIEAKERYSFPMAIIATALAFTVLILAIVTTSVRISEITTENSALQRQYDALVANENKLRMELEVRDDLRTVEEYAKNEYGMVKQDQVERYYLRTYNADKIELIEDEKPVEEDTITIADRIIGAFRKIGGRVLAFFGK